LAFIISSGKFVPTFRYNLSVPSSSSLFTSLNTVCQKAVPTQNVTSPFSLLLLLYIVQQKAQYIINVMLYGIP